MTNRKISGIVAALASFWIGIMPAMADNQASIVTPTSGPMSASTFTGTYLNPALLAIQTCNWGTIAPANGPGGVPAQFQCWGDTSAAPTVSFKFYDGASWVLYGKLNTTTHIWTPVYQGTDLGTAAIANTGTSGHTLPFLDGANAFTSAPTFGTALGVPSGGTGQATLTNHGILIGQGTGGIVATSVMVDAQLLVGLSGADPVPRTISGDVTFGSTGVTAIGTAKVTSAMLRNSGALSVIGRSANSAGVPADISCTAASDAVLRESGSVLGCGTIATAGIANNAVTNAKIRQGLARSVIGVTGNATANVDDIQGTTDQVMRINGAGTAVAFGAIDLSKVAAATGILQAASMPALTGDITTAGGVLGTVLATVNANTGSFGSSTAIPNFTVNAKGLITSAGTSVVIAPAGTLTGTTLNSTVTASSLISFGSSPGFTGVPTAPTAAVDTNTTQLATQAAIMQQAAAATPLIDGTAAPGTSLRYARADHIHPTDTSRVPTTRNINTGCALAGGGDLSADRTIAASRAINAQTGTTYTVLSTDCGKLVTFNNASAVAVTLPVMAANFWNSYQNIGAGTATVTPASGTINGFPNIGLATGQGMDCYSDGTNALCQTGTGSGGGSGVTSFNSRTGTVTPATGDYTAAQITSNVYGMRNRLINPEGVLIQRGAGSVASGSYSFDRWYILTQTAAITTSQIQDQENGTPFMMRHTQAQATAQRMMTCQIVAAANIKDLRGATVTLSARLQTSSAITIRYAILEWTGTADVPTRGIVNSWTSTTYTPGNFFISTTTTVTAVGATALSASTLTSVSLTGTFSSSMNNALVCFWTDAAAAQNVTMDVGRAQLEVGAAATPFARRSVEEETNLALPYYRKLGYGMTAFAMNSTTVFANTAFFPPMRKTPTYTQLLTAFVFRDPLLGGFTSSGSSPTANATSDGIYVEYTGFTGLTSQHTGAIATAAIFSLDSEL